MKFIAQLRTACILFTFLTLLTGVGYPLLVTGIAQTLFPFQANGSLIEKDGQVLGSVLIGQPFASPDYFWSRPSTTAGHPYNALDMVQIAGSVGSNLGPLSQTLIDQTAERVEKIRDSSLNDAPIPVDLVSASASGLDPHISLAAAYYQIPRVARERGMNDDVLRALVNQYAQGRQFGLLGEPRVNVLLLNLALDAIQ